MLVKWHLGIPLISPTPCRGCGQQQDSLGDHAVSCRHSNPWARHQHLAHAVAAIASEVGIPVQTEVALPNSYARPADLLLSTGASGHTAVDITIRHALPPSTSHSVNAALNVPDGSNKREPEPVLHRVRLRRRELGIRSLRG